MTTFSPTAWRPVIKLLHWSTLAALIATLVAGNTTATRLLLSLAVAPWAVGTLLFGLAGRPGPALTGLLRRAFVPAHALLLALLCLCSVTLWSAPPGALAGSVRTLVLLTLGAGLLHGVFHMWRHTALRDGALRNMTPRRLHGLL